VTTFTIRGVAHKGKHISVTKYKKHPSGLEIEIRHNVPTSAGKKLRWVQTLSSNHPEIKKCKLKHGVVDPFGSWDPSLHKVSLPGLVSVCKADDLKPFYYTDAEFTSSGSRLTDMSSSPKPATGRYWCSSSQLWWRCTDKQCIILWLSRGDMTAWQTEAFVLPPFGLRRLSRCGITAGL